jgi:hypothetical protein
MLTALIIYCSMGFALALRNLSKCWGTGSKLDREIGLSVFFAITIAWPIEIYNVYQAGKRNFTGDIPEGEYVRMRAYHAHALQSPIPAMPEGWVPLTIEYEPGYPEDAAFGPPIMMERLKKWLDKYYAMLRQPKPEVEAKPVVWMLKEDFDALTKPDDDESLPDGVEAVVFNRRPDVGQWQPLYTSPPSSDLSAQVASVAEDVSADTFLDIPVFLRKKNPNYQGD